jgi:hypothetical protein
MLTAVFNSPWPVIVAAVVVVGSVIVFVEGSVRSLKGNAIVGLNDHPDIRRAFDGYYIETVDVKYTVGGGEREAARKEIIFQLGRCGRTGWFILARKPSDCVVAYDRGPLHRS